MRNSRGGLEIGEMSLREPEIAVEAVDQNLECVLQRVEVALLFWIFRRTHLRFHFEAERAEIGEQMAKDLQLIGRWKAIELQHD